MMRSFWLAITFSLATTTLAKGQAVQLLLPSRQLEPASTFELRFANEMVPATDIGKVAPVSPLVFSPGVEGQFVWLSTRSGTFAPKGILPLGTKYQIALRNGLKDTAGREVKSTLRETAETPPIRVKGVAPLGGADPEDASANPRYLILFNADVAASGCAKFFRFINGAGLKIEARVEQADDPKNRDYVFPSYQSDDRTLTGWGEKPAAVQDETDPEQESDKTRPPRKNVLFVTATKPLAP